MRRIALAAALAALGGPTAHAQGYRVRLDTRLQTASFRGVDLDSIPAADAIAGAGGGLETADGFAVTCGFDGFCRFFRPGAPIRSAPLVQQVDGWINMVTLSRRAGCLMNVKQTMASTINRNQSFGLVELLYLSDPPYFIQ